MPSPSSTTPSRAGARPRAERFRIEGARGRRYRELTPETPARLLAWLEAGTVPEGEPIKPGRVYRVGEWVVKLFERDDSLRAWLRPSPAARCARQHLALQAVGTPLPIATLEVHRGASLLVMERIDGVLLQEVLAADDRTAIEAFPAFMASMHARGVYHGDFHPFQLLWDGGRWHLLDLDGLRHPFRRLRRKRLVQAQWGRLQHNLEGDPRVRDMFRAYLTEAWPGWDEASAWSGVEGVAAMHRERRRARLARAQST